MERHSAWNESPHKTRKVETPTRYHYLMEKENKNVPLFYSRGQLEDVGMAWENGAVYF